MFLPGFPYRHWMMAACLFGVLGPGRLDQASAATDAVVRTTQQGVHSWQTASGRLYMVAGTYQDTTAYRRSVSFYFQSRGKGDWQQVPIAESEVDLTTEWTTASRGETTLRDAVVVPRGQDVYLVIAERSAGKPAISVKRYRFSPAGTDFPDGPGMLFVPLPKASRGVAAATSVEAVLDGEIATLAGN